MSLHGWIKRVAWVRETLARACDEGRMTVSPGEDLFVRSTLLHTPQLIIDDVIVERVFRTICLLVLLLQFRSQFGLVNILRCRFWRRCEAQSGINLARWREKEENELERRGINWVWCLFIQKKPAPKDGRRRREWGGIPSNKYLASEWKTREVGSISFHFGSLTRATSNSQHAPSVGTIKYSKLKLNTSTRATQKELSILNFPSDRGAKRERIM